MGGAAPARITQSCDLKSATCVLGYARLEERMSTSPAREVHGRDAELALIQGELERLSDGAEAVVVVEGPAGMGKSRLLAEVSTMARALGIRVGSSAAEPGEAMVELALIMPVLIMLVVWAVLFPMLSVPLVPGLLLLAV